MAHQKLLWCQNWTLFRLARLLYQDAYFPIHHGNYLLYIRGSNRSQFAQSSQVSITYITTRVNYRIFFEFAIFSQIFTQIFFRSRIFPRFFFRIQNFPDFFPNLKFEIFLRIFFQKFLQNSFRILNFSRIIFVSFLIFLD